MRHPVRAFIRLALCLGVTAIVSACHRNSAERGDLTGESSPAPRAFQSQTPTQPQVQSQIAKSDPCAWLPRAAAEKAIGASLTADPERVSSTDNLRASPNGQACRYRVSGANPEINSIAVQVTADESGLLRISFQALGIHEPGLLAGSRNNTWDFVAQVPGGLTVRIAGRFAVLTAAPGQNEYAEAFANAILAQVQDIPFTVGAEDPTAPAPDHDACALLKPEEVAAVIGRPVTASYRSRKQSALVHGGGVSCAYYLGNHQALVLTPEWRDGKNLFQFVGLASQLVSAAGVTTHDKPRSAAWDATAIGPADALYVLKGDQLFNLQFVTAGLSRDQAIALLDSTLPRLKESP